MKSNVVYGILLVIEVCLLVFYYWGVYTASGRSHFDEMDGIIPWASGLLALTLAVIVLVVWLIRKFL